MDVDEQTAPSSFSPSNFTPDVTTLNGRERMFDGSTVFSVMGIYIQHF